MRARAPAQKRVLPVKKKQVLRCPQDDKHKKKAVEHARGFTLEAVQHDTLLRKVPRRWLRHPGARSFDFAGRFAREPPCCAHDDSRIGTRCFLRIAGEEQPYATYSSTKMFLRAQMSLRILGQTLTVTSPKCALRNSSMRVRACPTPPPMLRGI